MIRRLLGPELRALPDAVIVPLGKATEAVEFLCQSGQLDASRCVLGFPHPSPASARRHEIFADRRREASSDRSSASVLLAVRSPRQAKRPRPRVFAECTRTCRPEIKIELHRRQHPQRPLLPARASALLPPRRDRAGQRRRRDGHDVGVHFAGDPDPVITDIAGGNKMMLRCRGRIAAFSVGTTSETATASRYAASDRANTKCARAPTPGAPPASRIARLPRHASRAEPCSTRTASATRCRSASGTKTGSPHVLVAALIASSQAGLA